MYDILLWLLSGTLIVLGLAGTVFDLAPIPRTP